MQIFVCIFYIFAVMSRHAQPQCRCLPRKHGQRDGMGHARPNRCECISAQLPAEPATRPRYHFGTCGLLRTKPCVVWQMFWFDIAPVGSSSIENHRKSNQLDDFIPFGLFDAKGFGMTFDPSVFPSLEFRCCVCKRQRAKSRERERERERMRC